MRQFAKKTLCLLLALLMLLPLIVACKKDEEGEGTDTEVAAVENAEESSTESNKYDVQDDLGDVDLGGRVVKIAQADIEMYRSEIDVERMTGDIVNDAIYKRNAAVEKRCNCDIQAVVLGQGGGGVTTVLTDLESNVLGSKVGYDAFLNTCWSTGAWVTRELFKDLRSIQSINFDKIYWGQFANDAIEIGGKQYMATGAIALTFYKMVFVTVVNNDILKQTAGEVPNLLQMAKDGTWTIKKQKELAEQYYIEGGSRYGFVSWRGTQTDGYFTSGGLSALQKDPNGFLTWAFDLEKATNVMTDVAALYGSKASKVMEEWHEAFATGKTLMTNMELRNLEEQSIREMTSSYTVLPIPKYSEDEKIYHSCLNDYVSVLCVPVTVSGDDVETVGKAIEAMASESWRTVAEAYYEVALKIKYIDNPDAWDVVDHIIENVSMDPVMPYIDAVGEFMKLWRGCAASANANLGSVFNNTVKTQMETKLNGDKGLNTFIRRELARS